jgi:anti-sigma factor RsiW
MNCDELLAALNDYVDGDVRPGICAEFERHLAGCNPCQVVVDNIRQTIVLYRAGEPVEMPPAFHSKLHAALRQHWKRQHPETLSPG